MMRLRQDLAAAWANGRRVVVVVFAAGLLAGALLSWFSGFTPRAGRYTIDIGKQFTTRTDTMTGEIVIYGVEKGKVFRLDVTKEGDAR